MVHVFQMISNSIVFILLIHLKLSIIQPTICIDIPESSPYGRDGQSHSFVSITVNITAKGINPSVTKGFVPIISHFPEKSPQILHLVPVTNFVNSKKKHDACSTIYGPTSGSWAALVELGDCEIETVLSNLHNGTNISAILLFGHLRFPNKKLLNFAHTPLLLVKDDKFNKLNLLLNSTAQATISFDNYLYGQDSFFYKNSVLFVSISFILIMIISFAWLIFYYVQRFRYIHAKEKFARRLENAARKAITKIPERTLLSKDDLLNDESSLCVVCLENYQLNEVVRELPCKHIFHRKCVDPWLIDQRKCPMCKMDILHMYDLKTANLDPDTGMQQPSLTELLVFLPHSYRENRSSVSRGGTPDSSESCYQLVELQTVRAEMAN